MDPLVGQPTLADIKELLSVSTSGTDDLMQNALDSAVAEQRKTLNFPTDSGGQPFYPPELISALVLRVSRFLSRRSSPAGVVGFGDFGAVTVPRGDADIDKLEMPFKEWRPW